MTNSVSVSNAGSSSRVGVSSNALAGYGRENGARGHTYNRKRERGNGKDFEKRGAGERPRLTHFLSVPLGHHDELRRKVSAFSSSLLQNSPPIVGLDETIVVPAQRMHVTIGVMSLSNKESSRPSEGGRRNKDDDRDEIIETTATVRRAVDLLESLRPSLEQHFVEEPIGLSLDYLDVMKIERQRQGQRKSGGRVDSSVEDLAEENAHVLFVGPDPTQETAEWERLKEFCDFLKASFIREGLMIDEGRPLKLHLTLLNTIYRRQRGSTRTRGGSRRIPFSWSQIRASDAFRAIASPPIGQSTNSNTFERELPNEPPTLPPSAAKKISFGSYPVDRIQICEMGSKDAEGAYASVGEIQL